MKKLAALILVLILICAIPFSAFAHGHDMKPAAKPAAKRTYSVCNVENCNISDKHTHGSHYYYGHTADDGHDYHKVCKVSGCEISGSHEHNGVTCFGNNAYSGTSHCGRHG